MENWEQLIKNISEKHRMINESINVEEIEAFTIQELFENKKLLKKFETGDKLYSFCLFKYNSETNTIVSNGELPRPEGLWLPASSSQHH